MCGHERFHDGVRQPPLLDAAEAADRQPLRQLQGGVGSQPADIEGHDPSCCRRSSRSRARARPPIRFTHNMHEGKIGIPASRRPKASASPTQNFATSSAQICIASGAERIVPNSSGGRVLIDLVHVATEIDHIAIAVATSTRRSTTTNGVRRRGEPPRDRRQRRRGRGAVEGCRCYIQLTAATRPDSPIARSIEKRGEGLHHVGYRVDDCAAALAAMVAAGATAIDAAPRPGSRGTTVAFIHPKGSFGTLIELVQE